MSAHQSDRPPDADKPALLERAAQSSQAEDDFVSLFAEVFGVEKTQLLAPEFPFLDIDGTPRFMDFALRAAQRNIAFEVDGPTHYQPPDFGRNKYEDDLLRQNSLTHQSWQVCRWTDHELARRADRVKAQLELFLANLPGLLEMDDFLPRQTGAEARFNPAFTLGLTATPERPEGKPVLELFRNAAHRLTLKEAIERGELVPIQYNRQDLETSITVPARNELIVETYLEHVQGRKGVTFCVNVRHGEALAELYRQQGVPARSVLGSMPTRERDEALAAFARGEVLMLCACDLLNEGWDCPDMQGRMPCHFRPPQWPKMQKPGNRAFPVSSDFWPGRPINQVG